MYNISYIQICVKKNAKITGEIEVGYLWFIFNV